MVNAELRNGEHVLDPQHPDDPNLSIPLLYRLHLEEDGDAKPDFNIDLLESFRYGRFIIFFAMLKDCRFWLAWALLMGAGIDLRRAESDFEIFKASVDPNEDARCPEIAYVQL
ncbi:MAG: hypothetical protein M1812_005806 [Candelaria pacifica]|nr:MAG: hypothetical protein M1812_005806 [Candelaria pacifica]